ncbi:MAG: ABC transporter ATP-binding protein [Blautia sp.]|nr:ABC transporter ATP-binding protein [Blautia sp.]
MHMMELTGLTRDYGGGKGIFNISFQVEEGEAFGFLGPNGAGKTTTIRHLMGFIRPKEGMCQIRGRDCWKERDMVQKRLGYIPGEISFLEDMTGREYLRFVARYRGMEEDGRTQEMLERFPLDPKEKIKKMSKGTRQKLGIVAAFMHDPDILVLDEPTSGLDPLMQSRFIELLGEEKKRGKTILLSSHMFEEVERTCDRIGILREGRLMRVDSVATLRERHMKTYDVELGDPETAQAFARDFHGICQGTRVLVTARQTLEEIFLQYYGGEE